MASRRPGNVSFNMNETNNGNGNKNGNNIGNKKTSL